MLDEAYECLDADRNHRGRGRQTLELTSGKRKRFAVSPHFQLRQAFWPRNPSSISGWRVALDHAMSNLRPLHRVVSGQARA